MGMSIDEWITKLTRECEEAYIRGFGDGIKAQVKHEEKEAKKASDENFDKMINELRMWELNLTNELGQTGKGVFSKRLFEIIEKYRR